MISFAKRIPSRLPPGPTTSTFRQTYGAVARPLEYIRSLQAEFGDVISFNSLAGRGIAICDPAVAREVFAAPPEAFRTPQIAPNTFGPQSVIATWGPTHKKQRKLLNPHFNGQRIKAMYETMASVVQARLADVPIGRTIALTDVTQSIALDIILSTVFGDASGADLDHGRKVLRRMVKCFAPAILISTRLHSRFFPPWRKYADSRADFDAWVDGLIADRRKRGALGDDLLGLFLVTKYEDGEAISDAEIRDQLVTLLLAGHETSATAIAWAIYWLHRTPSTLARLRDELGAELTPDALVKHAYLNAVCSETLRIEPIVTDIMRVVKDRFQLRQWTLEQGETIAVMMTGILKNPRIFPEPDRFRPERFLERTYSATEFLPFGGGSRRCLGAAFAEAEMAIAIGFLARDWNLELVDREERSVRHNITMGPKHGVRVRFVGRRAVSRSKGPPATSPTA
ncbi:MAG: cytochrome P450 [Labilithrix sp.]